jgi:hypothetical protein
MTNTHPLGAAGKPGKSSRAAEAEAERASVHARAGWPSGQVGDTALVLHAALLDHALKLLGHHVDLVQRIGDDGQRLGQRCASQQKWIAE